MAFLCPSRRSRQKKKKKEEQEPYLGRITGSASVDTLVRVGLEKQHGLSPEARMLVLDHFDACAADELSVESGQTVYMLYTEQEWMYVLLEDGREGFIPRSFAKPFRSPAQKKRIPPTPPSQIRGILPPAVGGTDDEGNDGDQSNSPTNSSSQAAGFPDASLPEEDQDPHTVTTTTNTTSDQVSDCEGQQGSNVSEQEGEESNGSDLPDILPFGKREQGKWVVLFSHDVVQENDVKVSSGEVVTLLNSDDKDWFWIRRSGGEEGFVPRTLICKLPDDFRINDKIPLGFKPPTTKKPAQTHHRSRSVDHHTSLSAYLKPPPPHPPPKKPSTQPAMVEDSRAGLYNVPRATAYSAARQRPHSSMGVPVPSPESPQQPSVPLTAVSSEQDVSRPKERPRSSMELPMTSSLSQSQVSLPLAVSSAGGRSSGGTAAPRPHSAMGYPATSSAPLSLPPPSVPVDSPPTQYSSFPNAQRLQDSASYPSKSHWTAVKAAVSSGSVPNSGVPASSSSPSHVPPPNSAAVFREHQRPDRISNPRSVSAERAGFSGHRASPLSVHGSVSKSAFLPPKGPQSPPSKPSGLHSSSADGLPLSSSSDHPRSPPANHIPPSYNTANRNFPGQTNSPQLTRSLNSSQDGRRPALFHQLSVPDPPVQRDSSSGRAPHIQVGHPSQERGETREDSFRPHSNVSRPRLGEAGRSKSSPHFTGSPIPNGNVTELMTLRKFSSRGVDDISVSSDEVVYGDLDKQPERDWLWVYSPKLHRHGYIPRTNVRLPGNAGDLRSENVARV